MPKIDSYSFGMITVDGKTYTSDVIIFPDRVNPSWWRKEGHLLQLIDLTEVFEEKPDVLIIGTGYSGIMKVADETVKALQGKNIDLYIEKTNIAVDIFNSIENDRKAIATLHLTC